MSFDEPWVSAVVAIAAGFLVGAVLAALARSLLGSEKRRKAVQTIAKPTGAFIFWISVVTGIVVALGATSPETLKPIPSDILGWLPRALVAGLLVLAGYAGGGVIAGTLGSAAKRATGQRSIGLEKAVRWGVLAAAIVLALGNLGIETTALQILVAGLIFTVGLATALIAAMGGRDVAANVAAGRTLRTELGLGKHLAFGSVAGTIVKLRPAAVIIRNDDRPETTTVIPAALLLTEPFELTD